MKRPKDVDEYIASIPKNLQPKLKQLRAAIKSVAPKALEKISYGMPYYGYKGRVAYFRLAKKHIGFFVMTPIVTKFKKELADYSTTNATIRFPLDKKLPIPLIKRMIKARVKMNEETKK